MHNLFHNCIDLSDKQIIILIKLKAFNERTHLLMGEVIHSKHFKQTFIDFRHAYNSYKVLAQIPTNSLKNYHLIIILMSIKSPRYYAIPQLSWYSINHSFIHIFYLSVI